MRIEQNERSVHVFQYKQHTWRDHVDSYLCYANGWRWQSVSKLGSWLSAGDWLNERHVGCSGRVDARFSGGRQHRLTDPRPTADVVGELLTSLPQQSVSSGSVASFSCSADASVTVRFGRRRPRRRTIDRTGGERAPGGAGLARRSVGRPQRALLFLIAVILAALGRPTICRGGGVGGVRCGRTVQRAGRLIRRLTERTAGPPRTARPRAGGSCRT